MVFFFNEYKNALTHMLHYKTENNKKVNQNTEVFPKARR